VSAGVESSVGVKSNEKIIEFLDRVKSWLEYKKEN
jgi:phosphoribosylanthranilate isomerase